MKKTRNLIIGIVVLVLAAAGCKETPVQQKNVLNTQHSNTVVVKSETQLAGTSWKLVGFFDVEKNTLREAEPKDCDDCYTINFDKDTTFTCLPGTPYEKELTLWVCNGKLGKIIFEGSYVVDYTHSTIDMHNRLLRIAMQDTHDGELYHTALEAAKTFELSDTELKLYYNNGKNYLLFKKR